MISMPMPGTSEEATVCDAAPLTAPRARNDRGIRMPSAASHVKASTGVAPYGTFVGFPAWSPPI